MYGGWTRCHHPEHSSAGPPMSTPKDLLIFQEDFLKFRQNDIQLHDITRSPSFQTPNTHTFRGIYNIKHISICTVDIYKLAGGPGSETLNKSSPTGVCRHS